MRMLVVYVIPTQAMCSLGGLTQGVSAPLEAAAEEIQMTQARLMDAQAQLQAQAAEHTEHLKWRFAEEEEMRMESEGLRRRTQVSSRQQGARSGPPGRQQDVLQGGTQAPSRTGLGKWCLLTCSVAASVSLCIATGDGGAGGAAQE